MRMVIFLKRAHRARKAFNVSSTNAQGVDFQQLSHAIAFQVHQCHSFTLKRSPHRFCIGSKAHLTPLLTSRDPALHSDRF